MKVANFYTKSPGALEIGEVFPMSVVFYITRIDWEEGKIWIKGFRTNYPAEQTINGIPQGGRMYGEAECEAFKALCPSLAAPFEVYSG